MTAKEILIFYWTGELIFYWTGEVETHFNEWKKALDNGDEEKAKIEKQRYIDARKTLESL